MATEPPELVQGCALRLVGFDFGNRTEFSLRASEMASAFVPDKFVWVDVQFGDASAGAREFLGGLGLLPPDVIDAALTREPATQSARYDHCLHFVLSDCKLEGSALQLSRIDCVVTSHALFTIHRSPSACLSSVRRTYSQDFQRFAKTPSFLIFELWDHLVESYIEVQRALEDRVDALRTQLIRHADEAAFARVAELGSDLLNFRKVLLLTRTVLQDLGTRRSLFVSDATQQFLMNLVGTVEHVQQELLVDRDVLSDALDLHMSMITHRTNKVMTKLTVASVIFMPLTFLCGVYGMNFRYVPELEWSYGYPLFWIAVVVIGAAIAWFCHRIKLW
jgi:magnesium transporter